MSSRKDRVGEKAAAFGRRLSPLLTPAYRLAFGLCLDPAAAEDAVLNAAEKAFRTHRQLRPGSSLWRWFAGIVRREARPVELAMMLPAATHDPELRRLKRLSFEDRCMLLLHYYADLSIEELAPLERLNKIEASARLALARERVRPLLGDLDEVGPLDDPSLAHRLRALVGGLGDPGPDFQERINDAIAGSRRRAAYQRSFLALVAALLVLCAIALIPSGLRALGALAPHRPVAAGLTDRFANEGVPDPAQNSDSTSPPAGALALSDAALPGGEVGVGWLGANYAVSGGTAPYRWSVAPANPFGLAVNPGGHSLTIAGTPTAAGSTAVTITVTDSRGLSQNRTYSLTIAPALTISGPVGGNGGQGEAGVTLPPVFFTAAGGNGAYSWTLTPSPPPGTSVSSAGRVLSLTGAPSSPGDFSFTVAVSDGAGARRSASFTLRVETQLLVATPTRMPDAQVNELYFQRVLAEGGVQPYAWDGGGSLGASGLTAKVDGDSILVSGTPTLDGDFTFTAGVRDSCQGCTGRLSQTYLVHVSR